MAANFSYFHLKINAGITYFKSLSKFNSETDRRTEQI